MKNQMAALLQGWKEKNPSLTLQRVSFIAYINQDQKKWKDIQIELDTPNGIFSLFAIAALFNFMGGGNGKVTFFRQHYDTIMKRDFSTFKPAYRSLFEVLAQKVDELVGKFPEKTLQGWWQAYQDQAGQDKDLAARRLFGELFSLKCGVGKRVVPVFTSKAFWMARELHALGVWSDFPLAYTCVPDSRAWHRLDEVLETKGHLNMFLVSELMARYLNDPDDKYHAYDLPAFDD
jgi:hypothetical protein